MTDTAQPPRTPEGSGISIEADTLGHAIEYAHDINAGFTADWRPTSLDDEERLKLDGDFRNKLETALSTSPEGRRRWGRVAVSRLIVGEDVSTLTALANEGVVDTPSLIEWISRGAQPPSAERDVLPEGVGELEFQKLVAAGLICEVLSKMHGQKLAAERVKQKSSVFMSLELETTEDIIRQAYRIAKQAVASGQLAIHTPKTS